MTAREKVPDGGEPLIIQEGGEPTSKDEKPADKPESGPAKHPDERKGKRPLKGSGTVRRV
jgi:hypothetical protein